MTTKVKVTSGTLFGMAGGLGIGLGIITGLEPADILKFFSETVNSQIAQAGFFFTMAAWIHSGRVKKEIGKNFTSLTDAIDRVAVTLRNDLAKQAEILENHGSRIDKLEKPRGANA